MRSRMNVGVVCFGLCLFMVIFLSTRRTSHVACPTLVADEPRYHVPIYLRNVKENDDKHSVVLHKTLKDERNKLSKELNEQRRKLGQQECERDANQHTNTAGGWCRNSSMEDGGQHMTDLPLVKGLSEFLRGKTVGSFGDGPGAYKREMLKLNQVKLYDAFDGAPFCEETSKGMVTFMDLTVPQYGIPMYDWVLSLEVAEHIPKEFEPVYIDNLVRHSREGIIMSWAVPGQGGLAHINNRPFSYVTDLMEFHGFKYDNSSSQDLKLKSSFQWLRENVNIFRRVKSNSTFLKFIGEWYS
ncbi:uncharacterized protein LOC123566020 [Mercenaria mercenaria]|uniref:uncharacterized protein LOC123566020 n=1 Tax=Mercenaria mercenaria TaxID=6596 RepID=UPI001E1DED1A|nr:uncharacterized protein LOC123566020 [Mercenaria mercenaria]